MTYVPSKKPRVINVAFHRNGTSGASFISAIVQHPDCGRLLITDFAPDDDSGHPAAFAAINLDQAHDGNIYPRSMLDAQGRRLSNTGGNSYRGDRLAETYRPLIREALERQWDEQEERAQLGRQRAVQETLRR